MPENQSAGAILKAARISMQVSVREVADVLNLPVAVVEALEADDSSKLPLPVFARGYVRSYAKLLELDPAPLVASYLVPEVAPEATVSSEQEPPWRMFMAEAEVALRKNPIPFVVMGAALLVLLIGLIVWALWPSEDEQLPLNAVGGSGGSEMVAQMPEIAMVQQAGEVTASADTQTNEAIDSAVPGASGMAGTDKNSVHRRLGAGSDELDFTFVDECWVDVKTITGKTLYSDISFPGQKLKLSGQGPFKVLLGYAPGARMAFNHEPVALAPHTRDNVATLVIGQ